MSEFETEVLPTHSKAAFDLAVSRAATLVRDGAVVGVPTETVYGLAANALSASAVRKIYEAKGRPANNPLIVHVADWAAVHECVSEWTPLAAALARAFWPGPLTLVLPKSAVVPEVVTGGGDTVAVRWPSHPVMQAIIRGAGCPVAAPSANRSNALSPTQAQHVLDQLDGTIPLIVDGGPSAVGIESTVVDLVAKQPRVLRPGMIHQCSLQAVDDTVQWASTQEGQPEDGLARSPGQLKKHYAPKARLVVAPWQDPQEVPKIVAAQGCRPEETSVVALDVIPEAANFARVSVIPHDAEAYARALFSELHLCDAAGSRLIMVESPPRGDEWEGIWDRLRRAETVDC